MKRILFFLALAFSSQGFAALDVADKPNFVAKQLLNNGGFERGKASWTASGGTFAIVTSGTNLLTGNDSATWDSNGAAQTLLSTAVTIPKGLYGTNGVGLCKIQVPSGAATHTIEAYDGSNILGSVTILSSTIPTYSYVNFVFPSSGSISLRLKSVNADEPLIAIDDCFLASASEVNMTQVSQAQFIGSAYFATTASCLWTRATSTTLAAFATTAACPGPTVDINPGPGTIQTTDSDLPRVTVANLPPGNYKACFNGAVVSNTTNQMSFAIFDGTTTSPMRQGALGNGSGGTISICGVYNYTSAGSHSYELYSAASTSSTITLSSAVAPDQLGFTLEKFPSTTEMAYRPDAGGALSWSGYHDSTCSWTVTQTTFAADFAVDTTCALVERTNVNFGAVTSALVSADKLPGIVFTPKRVGRYYVCATVNEPGSGTASNTTRFRLTDGTTTIAENGNSQGTNGAWSVNLCGIYSATALTSTTLKVQGDAASGTALIHNADTANTAIEWSIFSMDQQIPAPLLVNSVVSSSSGVERIGRAYIANNGTCTITSQSGNWISSVAHSATGVCDLTITGFSAAPTCIAMQVDAAASGWANLMTGATSTFVKIKNISDTGTGTVTSDRDFTIICMGPN
jgi:hypothetical protein